jgi:ABC-2 type transport system permease protein
MQAVDGGIGEPRPGALAAYLAVLGVRVREIAQYRAAAWAGVFTQVVFGFIIFMTLTGFSASRPERVPMTSSELLAYVWLGQAFLGLLPWTVDKDVVQMVKTGSVAYELLRPLDLYGYWFCRALGWRLSATALRALPLLVLVSVIFPLVGLDEYAMPAPPSWACAGAFVVCFIVAVPLGIAITMSMQVTILWSLRADGIQRIVPGVVLLCGGMVIPLPMLPSGLQAVFYWLPFRGVVDVPYRAYSGSLAPGEALSAAFLSAAWGVALVFLGRHVMRRGLGRVVVQGG